MATRELNAGTNTLATCNVLNKYEKPVQSGLALTPRDVKEMTERGQAVSTPNIGQVQEDSASTGDWFIELPYRRGVDMNTVWEQSHITQNGLIRAHKLDKKRYG